jgi:metallophosphoesterase (TIGR00282 family)
MSTTITILFIGDIMGTPGMDMLAAFLPSLAQRHGADCIIANGENAMDGKSISEAQTARLFDLGVAAITSGNHIWEKWHIQKLMAAEPRLLRPANYPRENAGRGWVVVDLGAKGKLGVLNLQGRVFMQPIDCPFKCADWAMEKLAQETKTVVVDFHAEATAEKIAMGWYLDGRASAVIGTHTHVQTADARILPQGTAYITDAGMTGPYDSVVGMKKDIALRRFLKQTPHKFEAASDDVHVAGVVLRVDALTGRALSITPFLYPEFEHGGTDH